MTNFIYRCTGCGKTYAQHREKCGKCRADLRLEQSERKPGPQEDKSA